MRIRTLNELDINRLVEIGYACHQASAYGDFNFNPDKVIWYLKQSLTREDLITLVMVDDNEEPIGGILGCIAPHWFGNDVMAYDYVCILSDEHRKGSHGYQIYKAFIEEAKRRGATQVLLGTVSPTEEERDRMPILFKRLRMKHVGYVYELTFKE